jgi:hypothetical protein
VTSSFLVLRAVTKELKACLIMCRSIFRILTILEQQQWVEQLLIGIRLYANLTSGSRKAHSTCSIRILVNWDIFTAEMNVLVFLFMERDSK